MLARIFQFVVDVNSFAIIVKKEKLHSVQFGHKSIVNWIGYLLPNWTPKPQRSFEIPNLHTNIESLEVDFGVDFFI